MHQILLIDDDKQLAILLREYFQQFNFTLQSATLPSKGFALLQKNQYDLIILDIMLPEMDGFEVCKAIRKESKTPIIMLTARGEVMDRVVGFELGADDYLPKPFEPRELVARMQAVIKRVQSNYHSVEQKTLVFDSLYIDTSKRRVTINDNVLSLSTMEYQLLLVFTTSPQKTFTRDELLNRLKGIDADIFTRSIDILVSRLRQKIKPLNLIRTIRGTGYIFIGELP